MGAGGTAAGYVISHLVEPYVRSADVRFHCALFATERRRPALVERPRAQYPRSHDETSRQPGARHPRSRDGSHRCMQARHPRTQAMLGRALFLCTRNFSERPPGRSRQKCVLSIKTWYQAVSVVNTR